ncbi:MAG: Hydro-lyase family enzyme, Fe-S type, tartrate/fumarate subfamily [Acetothermia bacterium 64_32]|nr:MAG: Hydro-lyase family enzyme, Fe-S type, tartrate/fumarate subfamily [Acetothermia bacterium 64_32]MBC7105854.1 fumarate hydratase C-terminal domain-containing protein [Bacillota bacterium]HAF69815.1 fumarate hydratase [Candidatus Acetothermia bacterium]
MEKVLKTPIAEEEVRALKAGDVVYVSGTLFTARDEAHRVLLERGAPFPLEGLALFHCGPVVKKAGETWRVVAAGPTTSARMELFEAEFLEKFKPRVIIGKGGMGERTLNALSEVGAVYTHFTGGAGALAAQAIRGVKEVHFLEELGIPEAVWVFEVERFGPLVVAMDASGRSLYADLEKTVEKNMDQIRARIQGA